MPQKLSKSRILSGLQCVKRLHQEIHHQKRSKDSDTTEHIFEQGNKIGELACRQYPNGILIERKPLNLAIKKTAELLKDPDCPPLFEATFEHEGVLIQADILIPGKEGVEIIEVKSSTKIKKPTYLQDCAVQHWVITGAGYHIKRMELAHVNNQFVYEGKGNYDGLLKHVDVLEEISPYISQVSGWVEQFKTMLENEEPEMPVGPHCNKPYSCSFKDHCYAALGEWPITDLPNLRELAFELQEEGLTDIRNIPENRLQNTKQNRVRRVISNQVPELDPQASVELSKLRYPRNYIDFETITFAIPIWEGTRPFEQLPFQWSCHIEASPGNIDHFEFLDTSGNPPMKNFTENLIAAIDNEGPVLVYSSFEGRILSEMVNRYPHLSEIIEGIKARLFDLLSLTQKYYCHPEMRGSWSIKSVLPTVASELDYGNLEVQTGQAAQQKFLELLTPKINDIDLEKGRTELLQYCERDTWAMVKLGQFLSNAKVLKY